MFAIPFAENWIISHLFNLHGVAFNPESITWVPFFGMAMLFLTFWYIGIPLVVRSVMVAGLGAVMVLVEASNDPLTQHAVHADQGLLGWLGFSWHVFYLWVTAGVLFFIATTAAGDESEVPGPFRSFIEMMIEFVRDVIVRPVMGKEDGDAYMPYLMSFFMFILVSNLLGLTPGSTTATGSIWVTGSFAVMALLFYHGMGIKKWGFIHYIEVLVPVHANMTRVWLFLIPTMISSLLFALDGIPMAGALACPVLALLVAGGGKVSEIGTIVLWVFLLCIEIIGHMAKPFALCVRLFANMTGGHAVLYVMIGFTFLFKSFLVGFFFSVPASFAIMLLELLVAGIQAFIFTMLVTVFLQGAVNPSH